MLNPIWESEIECELIVGFCVLALNLEKIGSLLNCGEENGVFGELKWGCWRSELCGSDEGFGDEYEELENVGGLKWWYSGGEIGEIKK